VFYNYLYAQNINTYSIPKQTINLYNLINHFKLSHLQEYREFEISSFVTFGEYKSYLLTVRKDSSFQYYSKLLPDSTMLPSKAYKKYMNGTEYDNYPVIGVSWDNALNFLRWKTLKDNNTDSLKFIYRLPHCSEWIAANYYLNR